MLSPQILLTNVQQTVKQLERRINNHILGVEGLMVLFLQITFPSVVFVIREKEFYGILISFVFLSLFTLVSSLYKQGAVSLMAINLFTNKEVHVKLDQNFKGLDVDEYLFTPDGNITSRFVFDLISVSVFSAIFCCYIPLPVLTFKLVSLDRASEQSYAMIFLSFFFIFFFNPICMVQSRRFRCYFRVPCVVVSLDTQDKN